MTQAPSTDVMQLSIVGCVSCDQLYLQSPRRQTCPTCGSPDAVEFFEFTAGPDGALLVGSAIDAIADAHKASAPADNGAAPSTLSPADSKSQSRLSPEDQDWLNMVDTVASYLLVPAAHEIPMREMFVEYGADPEAAATAVGRLEALRAFMHELRPPRPGPEGEGDEDEEEKSTSPETPALDSPAGEAQS